MPIAKMIMTLTGLMTVLTVLPSGTLGKEPSDSQSTVLLCRSLGEGEIICTAGPNQAPALLRDLWDGEAVKNYLAVYEFHVDWQMRDSSLPSGSGRHCSLSPNSNSQTDGFRRSSQTPPRPKRGSVSWT